MNKSLVEGPIWQRMIIFSLPILFGSFFQQLYNTVDAVVVGQFLGKGALAAVGGSTGIIFWLIVSVFQGLSSGAGVVIAQYVGKQDKSNVEKSINSAIIIAFTLGFIIMFIFLPLVPFVIKLVDTPIDIFNDSVIYLKCLIYGLVPNLLCSMGTVILHAIGNSKVPFFFLICSTFTNIVLDILFVTRTSLGVAGVALATILSQTLSTILIYTYLYKKLHMIKISKMFFKIDPYIFKRMIKIGFPAGFQSLSLAVTNLAIQSRINVLGTDFSASNAAFCKIGNLYWMITGALVLSLVTFISQNYGAGKIDRIKKGLKEGFLLYVIAYICVFILFFSFGRFFLSIFINDESIIKIGMLILTINTITYIFYMPVDILSGALRSLGDVKAPSLFTFFGICLLTVLYNVFIFPLKPSIVTVLMCYPVTWIITSIMYVTYYFKKSKMHMLLNCK